MTRKIPNNFLNYKKLDLTEKNLQLLTKKHNTKVGTWGELVILSGDLSFEFLNNQGSPIKQKIKLKEDSTFIIPPSVWHRLIINSNKEIVGHINFYCHPLHYFHKKYALTKPHSDVLNLVYNYLPPSSKSMLNILDMGCGKGRNSLYLNQLGYNINSVDINPTQINSLKEIITNEGLSNIDANITDLHQANFEKNYNVILLNVVLQFLKPDEALNIVTKAQNCTEIGGWHSITCPVQTDHTEWPESFSFILKENQLVDFYKNTGWAVLNYNEDYGHLHRCDKSGIPIRGRFASIIAQKVL